MVAFILATHQLDLCNTTWYCPLIGCSIPILLSYFLSSSVIASTWSKTHLRSAPFHFVVAAVVVVIVVVVFVVAAAVVVVVVVVVVAAAVVVVVALQCISEIAKMTKSLAHIFKNMSAGGKSG